MNATITRESTVKTTYEVGVPSYWKSEYQTFRVFKNKATDQVQCNCISDWGGRVEYISDYPANCIKFETAKEITKDEFLTALDVVYTSIETMLNDIAPEEDSMFLIRPTRVPTEEPKSN